MATTTTLEATAKRYQSAVEFENAAFDQRTRYATIRDFDFFGGKATGVFAIKYSRPENWGDIQVDDIRLEEFGIEFSGNRGPCVFVWFSNEIERFKVANIAVIIAATGMDDDDFLDEVI